MSKHLVARVLMVLTAEGRDVTEADLELVEDALDRVLEPLGLDFSTVSLFNYDRSLDMEVELRDEDEDE